jgi:hypothetical protein
MKRASNDTLAGRRYLDLQREAKRTGRPGDCIQQSTDLGTSHLQSPHAGPSPLVRDNWNPALVAVSVVPLEGMAICGFKSLSSGNSENRGTVFTSYVIVFKRINTAQRRRLLINWS